MDERENQRDNDTDRYVLAAQSRQVAGAAERKARARSPSSNNGLPACVLPTEAPVPDHLYRPGFRGDWVRWFPTLSSGGASRRSRRDLGPCVLRVPFARIPGAAG